MRRTKTGHEPVCAFIDNFGPACDCDGLGVAPGDGEARRARLRCFMADAGWSVDPSSPEGFSFQREIGEHRIMVCKIISGWQYVWCRGGGWTIREEGGFGTVQYCLDALWKGVTEVYDSGHDAHAELYRYKKATEFKPLAELEAT